MRKGRNQNFEMRIADCGKEEKARKQNQKW
jgi:hypothetical protein